MIKLNNKNITYVALADSNNSLKAPKEIWYADSSNSVKLVYRRKDALIEGEDYEKYHWLCGRNGAHINTNHKFNAFEDSFQIKAKIDDPTAANPNGGENDIFGYMQDNGYRCIAFYARGTGRLFFAYSNISSGGNQVYFENKTDFTATLSADGSNFTATCDGVAQIATVGNLPQGEYGDITIFRFGQILTSANYFHGDISYFNIEPNKIRMIPCKLLKPVPKWLDANGIRRQVGECGMIDLVSGKFYGNVNSVGTFTVENYYERKEWLVGDGSAYIDTGIIYPAERFNIRTYLINNNDYYNPPVESNFSQIVFTNRTGYPDHPYIHINSRKDEKVYYCDFYTKRVAIPWTVGIPITIDVSMDNVNTETSSSLQLFYSDRVWTTTPWDGSIGELIIQSQSSSVGNHFIPCTLTMDLPASMDANNIARTKGTSGMWDLVSDRFYGNVANSGTFKAVNLAEGVDYEVHQWLRIDVNTMQHTQMMSLPVNSYQFSFRRKWLRQGTYAIHSSYFGVKGYSYFTNQNKKMLIWDGANATHIYDSGTQFNLGDTITINCNAENYNFDEVSMPIYGVCNFIPFDCMVDKQSGGADIAFSTSSITVDGIERYIPVKLLKSIPSKYDANGIARQAGECGMYDTVNDVFYGNTASSGSFTVSDDS